MMTTNIKLMVVFSKLGNTFMNSLYKNLEELGMNPSAYTMLAHLNEVGRAKTQKLGEVAVITSGTITHMVNKLVKQGFVIKVQDDTDKRIFWIEITTAGKDAFNRVHLEHMKYLDALLSDFSEAEKLAFIEQIKYFGKTIEKKKELVT